MYRELSEKAMTAMQYQPMFGRVARIIAALAGLLLLYHSASIVMSHNDAFSIGGPDAVQDSNPAGHQKEPPPPLTPGQPSPPTGDDGKSLVAEQLALDETFAPIDNRTLGFGKVFAVGMNDRSDKRDALSLMSALTDFDIEWIEGVRPDDVVDKAVPFGINIKDARKDGLLGCWRGHMNAIRTVVERGLDSALIFEDDVDFDVHLREQLHDVARGTRDFFPSDNPKSPNSPYGDGWDVLWTGHCGEHLPENSREIQHMPEEARELVSKKHLIHNDKTVPSKTVNPMVDWKQFPPKTRILHMTADPICLFSYAVSQRGARKLLYHLSINGLYGAIDNVLADLCHDSTADVAKGHPPDKYSLNCISIDPTLMFHHRPKGRISTDSDIHNHGGDGAIREKGFTESIQYSARLNLGNLLAGRPAVQQYPDEAPKPKEPKPQEHKPEEPQSKEPAP